MTSKSLSSCVAVLPLLPSINRVYGELGPVSPSQEAFCQFDRSNADSHFNSIVCHLTRLDFLFESRDVLRAVKWRSRSRSSSLSFFRASRILSWEEAARRHRLVLTSLQEIEHWKAITPGWEMSRRSARYLAGRSNAALASLHKPFLYLYQRAVPH